MKLGGPPLDKFTDPESWAQAMKNVPYTATYCPCGTDTPDDLVREYERVAKEAGIIIAETGAWSNPISPNPDERKKSIDKCIANLDLADRIGAGTCVNISGSRGAQWDGPGPENLTAETFDMIVESVRTIIDAVKPKRSFYALETMPWAYPDSPESYVDLIKAIDRPQFAVHLDPVNIINSPQKYFQNGDLIRRCFELLGAHIKSCHAKDISLSGALTVHLSEVRPGLGFLDYGVFLRELDKLPGEIPLLLEHLDTNQEYRDAAAHIIAVSKAEGIAI